MPDRKPITPAQAALLSFVTHLEADDIFTHLHTTITLSLSNYAGEDDGSPTASTITSWYYTLELLKHIHEISVEKLSTSK